MNGSPWFKCYPSDFLNGVSELSPNELAVYTICMMRMYDESGAIADDPERIARRCNMRPTSCKKALDELCRMGKLVRDGGYLRNDRAQKVIISREKVSNKSASSARSGWEKRHKKANKNKEEVVRTHPEPDANAMPTRSQKLEARKKTPLKNFPPEIVEQEFPAEKCFKTWWEMYPKKVGKIAAKQNYHAALRTGRATAFELQAGLLRSVAFWEAERTDTQFIIDPERWLKKGKWMDDLTVRKKISDYDLIVGGVGIPAQSGVENGDGGADTIGGDSEARESGPSDAQPLGGPGGLLKIPGRVP